ncbi:unnamed protein product [Auanema sp. JU1783]|nr:unnamed protein product [Auanema sp. JU1783]
MGSGEKPKVHYVPKILNGGIAGIVGVTCVFPLDLIKTRLQNQKGTSSYNGIKDCFAKTLANAGASRSNQIRAFYQGASVNILLITPEKAIKLVANDFFRNILKKGDEKLSLFRGIVAGASAGTCQVIITTPMELLKIQMQQSTKRQSLVTVVSSFLREKGLAGLYTGLGPTLARDVTFSAIYFPLFASLDALGPRKSDNSGDAVFWASFLSGLTSGAMASFAVTPLDVVKTRCQYVGEGATPYKSMSEAFVSILGKEGPKALFKGAACRMMVMAPLFGIAQTVYYVGVAEKLLGYEKSQRV